MSAVALLAIILIVLLLALLMLFYQLGPDVMPEQVQSKLPSLSQHSHEAIRMAALSLPVTSMYRERRSGRDRRSFPLIRGQLGNHQERRLRMGRRKEDNLWNH
jgi:hypothetical protein